MDAFPRGPGTTVTVSVSLPPEQAEAWWLTLKAAQALLDATARHPDDEARLPGWLLDGLADLDQALTRAGLRSGYAADEGRDGR